MDTRYPITRTKILVPRRREQIHTRQRLLDLIYSLLDQKLIVISAPAGYGKTSLLIDFANWTHWPIAWFSLDPLDKDPFRFTAHLIATIQSIFPEFGTNAFSLLNNTAQDKLDLHTLTMVLVNDIYDHISEHFILVFDDYHLVEDSEAINLIVNQFLQDVDESCHLIISSRRLLSLPDMPLLVARNQVGGISYEEIAFLKEEIQSLVLQNYHLSLSNQSAEEITRLTEGWVTGLLLSTHLLGKDIDEQLRVARVSGVGLYDYLVQQVFEQQPDSIKEFLLRTSLLEEFNVNRCERVLGAGLNIQAPWSSLVEDVVKRNLFIQQVGDDNQYWFRYHHLFRDFLQDIMHQTRPDEMRSIVLSLADDYQERGDWDVAFNLYRQIDALEKMISLVEQVGSLMLTTGKFLSLQEWLSVLPPEVINTSPAFLSLRGAILVNSGEISQGIILFSQVIDRLQNTDRFNVVLILTMIRRAVSYRMIGNYKKSLLDSFQALEILEQEPILGKLRAETLRNIGLNHYYNGDFKEALNVLKQSLNIFESYKDEENIPRVLFNIALLDKVLGDYDLAERMYLKALKYWQSGSNFAWLADLLNNLGIIQQLRGDYINAAANFEKAIEYSRIISSPRSEAISLTSLGDLYRDMDAFDEAQQVYEHALGIAKQLNDRFLLFYLDLAEGNLSQIKGDLIKAKAFFDDASKKAIDSGSSLNDKMLMSELAMYWLKTGNGNKAYELASQSRFYFENEGHHIEAFRAAFTCVLSQILSGGRLYAIPDLELIATNIVENKYATPLIIQARNFLNILSSVISQPDVETLITRIITRVDLYESNLLSIRKKVRQQASIVDFEPPRIIIQSFGKGQVILKNKLITNSDWQTSTAKDMFFVFLAHEGGLTKDQVGLIFWPDASQEDVKLRFKNGLYRLRRAVGSQAIILDEDYYYFNRNLDYEYDADVFVTAIESANKITNPDQKIKLLETATKVYAGEYLPEIDGTWAIIPRRRYHLMHLEALMQLANIYFEKADYKVALRYCFQALSEDACLEQAHRIAMRIHAIMGNRAEITRQYEHCCLALKDEVNALPSKQTNELYEMLIHK